MGITNETIGKFRRKILKDKDIHKLCLKIAILLISTFLIAYMEEYIFRGSFLETSIWIKNNISIFTLVYALQFQI